MKTIKRSISFILVMLLALSAFSVLTAAAECEDVKSIKFINTLNWSDICLYSWDGNGSENAKWPGVALETNETNEFGQEIYTVDINKGWNIIFSGSGHQSEDILYDESAEIYYLTEDTNSSGSTVYKASTMENTKNNKNLYDNMDETHPHGGYEDTPYTPGNNTVYLNPNGRLGGGEWYAWTYCGDHGGEMKKGTEKNGIVQFSGIADYVKFIYKESDASSKTIGQTTGDSTYNGLMYEIALENDETDVMGNPYKEYTGSWAILPQGFGSNNTILQTLVKLDETESNDDWYAYTWENDKKAGNIVTGWNNGSGLIYFKNLFDNVAFINNPSVPDLDTDFIPSGKTDDLKITDKVFVADEEEKVTEKSGVAYNKYSGYWAAAPVQGAQETTAPAETTASETAAEKGLKVTCSVNGEVKGEIKAEKNVTVTYFLTAPFMVENAQGKLNYDSSVLELKAFSLPKINGPVINKKAQNKVNYNFTAIDAETMSGIYDFKNGGVFVTATFDVLPEATGNTALDLSIDELDGYESGKEIRLFDNGDVLASMKDKVFTSAKLSSDEENSEETSDEKGVKVTCLFNGEAKSEHNAEKNLTVFYYLSAPYMIESAQGLLTYDASVLKLKSFKLPNIPSAVINTKPENKAYYNFMGLDADNKSGSFDFKNGGIFVTASFDVVQGASGKTEVDLSVDEMEGYESGKNYSFFEKGVISEQMKDKLKFSVQLTPDMEETEQPVHEKGVKVTCSLNGQAVADITAEKNITVSYYLTAPVLLESAQGQLNYDSKVLTLKSAALPKINEGLVLNKNVENKVFYNFTSFDAETKSGVFDFKNGGVFVTATFGVVPGAKGNTAINLVIDELDGYENGNHFSLIENGAVLASMKDTIKTSIQFSADTEDVEESTAAFEDIQNPSEVETTVPETTIETTAATRPETEIQEPTEEASQATEKLPQTISAKSFNKVNGAKDFRINAKSSGNGKLRYSSSNKKIADVSSDGKVSIKGCGKATVTITAAETADYLKAVKKITVTVKPARVKIKSTTAKKNKITIKVNSQKGLSSYEVKYADNPDFKGKKSFIAGGSKSILKISGVSSGKVYYIKIRAKAKISGKTFNSVWTNRKIKVK